METTKNRPSSNPTRDKSRRSHLGKTSEKLTYTAKELTPATWSDFERLFGKHNGVWEGCWCMFYQVRGKFATTQGPQNKRAKKALVKRRRSHGILVYSNSTPVGWCQYGPKIELPRTDASRTYQALDLDTNGSKLWRITCFFVDRDYRKKGVARFALDAALSAITKRGGGTVEAYPSTKAQQGASMMWSGTMNMFENAGFKVASQLGKSHLVMRKTVS